MKKTIFVASAIDDLPDKGMEIRLQMECVLGKYYNLIGAGFGKNPIINFNNSRLRKKEIMDNDIKVIRKADIFLIVTDLKTFSVGTWAEMWEAYTRGIPVSLYITGNKELHNIFLESICSHIVYNLKTFIKDVGIEINTD